MAEKTPEPESTDTGVGKAGGPALPRKAKSPVTYAKGPAPDADSEGGRSAGEDSTDTGVQQAGGPALPRKKAGGGS
ncbi:hypothetical protein [Streptomyces sp. NPDC091879]|uniref:hypothetical protein n=1 Tax=Streptomyces sp. NPDC091879 TaxID=3366006 RepID=UPI0037F98CA6